MTPTSPPFTPLSPEAVDSLLASAAVNVAPGRGAKLAPGLNAQLAGVAALAASLPFEGEPPGFVLALAKYAGDAR